MPPLRLAGCRGRRTAPAVAPSATAPGGSAPPGRGAGNGPHSELAKEIWQQTVRIRRDWLALDYLVCRRGITAWDDDRLRWHERVGCIVAPVVSHITGMTIGIWRIRPVMEGKVERRGLGPAKHNFSPTWWPDGDELGITEGVEDALAVRALTGLPCWAALSAGGMADLRGIPAWIRNVTVFADADEVGRRGAHALAHWLRENSKHVKVVRAITGKDANHILSERPADGVASTARFRGRRRATAG